MNKTIIKTAVAALFSLSLFSSCELDQEPYDTITRGESWSSVGDVDKHYIGLLGFVRAATGADANQITDVQTDLFNACAGAPPFTREHSWTFTSSIFMGDALWNFNYKMNLEANDMLEHVPAFYNQELTASQKKVLDKSKGLAYFCRAFAAMNLVTHYAVDYEPDGSAQTALAIPLVRKVDKKEKPFRATLQETCDFIQENIDSARKYMVSELSLYEPGPSALAALESRYLLYTHQFDKAIEVSKSLLSGYPLVASQADFVNMWLNDVSTETIYQPIMTPDELGADASLYLTCQFQIGPDGQPMPLFLMSSYVPTRGFLEMFEKDDYRYQYYFTTPYACAFDDPEKYPGLSMIANQTGNGLGKAFCKFQGNRNLLKNPKDGVEALMKNVNMTKPFRIAEQYLIIAESNLMKADRNEAEAREYLNLLRASRGASAIADNITGDQLTKTMQDEWAREMAGEGNRLDCLKRWHLGVDRKGMKTQVFYNVVGKVLMDITAGYVDLQIPADHYKFVWEIPEQDLKSNPNLVPNWKL